MVEKDKNRYDQMDQTHTDEYLDENQQNEKSKKKEAMKSEKIRFENADELYED